MKFQEQLKLLENKIKSTYEEGVTIDQAEKLAAEFLHAMMVVSGELSNKDLDARMKKSGNKSIRAGVYLATVQSNEKKPTEAAIAAMIETNDLVRAEQKLQDEAEVSVAELERYYSIFQNAHVYYRGIAKGTFNG